MMSHEMMIIQRDSKRFVAQETIAMQKYLNDVSECKQMKENHSDVLECK